MSVRRLRLALSSNAQRDLQNILVYSEQEWGRSQRRVYSQRFNQAFSNLRRHPDLGAARGDIGEGIRSLRVEKHIVIYQPSATEILILRILHVRRDLDAEFD